MNRGPFIFIGVFALLAFAWTNLVNRSIHEGSQLAYEGAGAERLPRVKPGLAEQGKLVYQEFGCVSCHTQQTRFGSNMDIARGWGQRQSVARDYLGQSPALLGSNRIGPDLTDVGSRRADPEWHLLHLYNPRSVSPKSNMPAHAFLFETKKISGQPSVRALKLEGKSAPAAGFEVVPTRDADALVAYMLSLKADYDLREAASPEKVAVK